MTRSGTATQCRSVLCGMKRCSVAAWGDVAQSAVGQCSAAMQRTCRCNADRCSVRHTPYGGRWVGGSGGRRVKGGEEESSLGELGGTVLVCGGGCG